MRLHRFFVSHSLNNPPEGEAGGSNIGLNDPKLLHQWKKVFRMKVGDEMILFDGSGKEFLGKIKNLENKNAVVEISEVLDGQENFPSSLEPKKEIYLFSSLIKKDNYEFVLQKCAEIGVSHFVPIISERTEKKNFNFERGQKIIREAAEQSGRKTIPDLSEPKKLEEIFSPALPADGLFGESGKKITCVSFDLFGKNFSAFDAGKIFAEKNPVGIFIGPEGGWSENDLKIFEKNNVAIYSLPLPVLRAETAAIVASTIFLI